MRMLGLFVFSLWHRTLIVALVLVLAAVLCRRRISGRSNGGISDKPPGQISMRIALILALVYIFGFQLAQIAELFDDPVGESTTAHVFAIVYLPLIALNRLLGYIVH